MNRILKFILISVAAVFTAVACSTEEEPAGAYLPVTSSNIDGTWMLQTLYGNTLPEGSFVYMQFNHKEGRFTIYDNQSSGLTKVDTGVYSVDESTCMIDGIYDHSYSHWNHVYVISGLEADRMVWTASDDPDEVAVYVRATLPEDLSAEE